MPSSIFVCLPCSQSCPQYRWSCATRGPGVSGKSAWQVEILLISCPRPMTKLRQLLPLAVLSVLPLLRASAQEEAWIVERLTTNSWVEFDDPGDRKSTRLNSS